MNIRSKAILASVDWSGATILDSFPYNPKFLEMRRNKLLWPYLTITTDNFFLSNFLLRTKYVNLTKFSRVNLRNKFYPIAFYLPNKDPFSGFMQYFVSATMHWCLLLSVLLISTPVLCLDLTVAFGSDDDDYDGYPDTNTILFDFFRAMQLDAFTDPFGNSLDYLGDIYGPEYSGTYAPYFNTASFAPWPAPHTTVFAPYYSYVGINDNGFYPFYFGNNGFREPGEYLGIYFDLPATELFAIFETAYYYLDTIISEQYYYNSVINNVFNWPFESNPGIATDYSELEVIFPFHITAKTVDGYFYYDWLLPRLTLSTDGAFTGIFNNDIYAVYNRFFLLASDPRGIDLLKVYSMIPENNRRDIYWGYNNENYQIPEYYHWLYLQYLIATIATPSTTRTITATTSPSPIFKRHPTFSATESRTITHTITPSASRTPIYKSESNTPTRTPNRSASNTPSRSSSAVPPVSPPPSASAPGQSATATRSAPASPSRSPVTPTRSPTVTNTATGTRTSFLTASNTQQPGRNVPSASIAPSASPAAETFTQPSSSTAVLVQFNVVCFGYCSGLSAGFLSSDIASALALDPELVRTIGVHEFFEGDSEITLLICSNSGVDALLNSIQAGSFTQDYFVSVSVESVDWTVRCNMDLYNYDYIPTASSASALLPLFVLFFLQLWMLA